MRHYYVHTANHKNVVDLMPGEFWQELSPDFIILQGKNRVALSREDLEKFAQDCQGIGDELGIDIPLRDRLIDKYFGEKNEQSKTIR